MQARGCVLLAGILLLAASRLPAQEVAVPAELEPWREWVLDDQRHRRCPFLADRDAGNVQSYRCAWPERLTLDLDARGGTFTQGWRVYIDSWVRLPGGFEHWPRDVRANGSPAAVVARNGAPSLRLRPGNYTITGRFAWSRRPESLPIEPLVALVDLRIDGRAIAQPERPDGALWLGQRRSVEQREQLDVQVYRLVEDETPVRLTTHIRLQVAGDAREIMLPRVLPEGFVPLGVTTPLAARLEPDGRMRIQVRAGSWLIELAARGPGVATKLARPATQAPWPREEIWSFAGNDRLRVAAVEGADGIDPEQADVPEDWQEYPAFRLLPDSTLAIVERGRGLANADDNQLTLSRRIWLDFDHGGFTAVDRLGGTMRKDWRLDAVPPFRLESAAADEDTLLVTESSDGKRVGVEVRSPALDVTTTARVDRSRGALPATGWNARFEQVSGELHLPPGHRLLAVFGADRSPTSWISRWGLWGFFGVLVVAVFVGWLAGPVVGIVALAGLLLTYQESEAYIWLWSNLLAAVALARAAPEGRLRRLASVYRTASFVVLAIALLPLLWSQLRIALYPQLEVGVSPGIVSGGQLMEGRVAAPAAPPPQDAAASASDAISSVVVTAERKADYSLQAMRERYAPGTVLQTGPGIPAWRYDVHPYAWSGPVETSETVRFVYIGPTLLAFWRIAGVVLLVLLFGALAAASFGVRPRGPASRFFGAVMIAALAAGVPTAHAADMPDAALLADLKQRLTRPPPCAPTCAEMMSAHVTASGDRLDVALEVSALASIAVALPSAADRWQLDAVSVDGRAALAITREGDATVRVPLEPGARLVRLSGRLSPAESIQLSFPAAPRVVTVSSDGWDVAGLNDGRLFSGSLELIRRRSAADGAEPLQSASEFPPFVEVIRNFALGLDWQLRTIVERVAPETAAISVEAPLLAGERVLTDGLEVRDTPRGRVALVGLERGQDAVEWSSVLPRTESLVLELPANAPRAEVLRFSVSPQWNVRFEGFPAVLPTNPEAAEWVYQFHPRPGETLKLAITRPKGVQGRALAIDSVRRQVIVGKRATDESLAIDYRSTQGGRHVITLPANARVSSVEIDGEPAQLRPDDGKLSVGLLPGKHGIAVKWTMPEGVAVRTRPSAVDLGSPASNVQTTLQLPADRWALFASGPGVGPVVLYWIELVVFLATAWLLGRWSYSPLRTHEWLLLGIGLSTFAWSVFVLAALWLFAMRLRERWSGNVRPSQFNLVQVLLAGLTVIAVGTLVFSGIRESLLGVPDMGVAGPGSGGNSFAWFLDQTESALPQPRVISAPMWVYRALMFAWALWIAVALLRWVRWSWSAWKSNGFWRGKVQVPV
ncbi:MAG: hypothetical protein ACT4O5_09015 [Gammaproteobacteria bacterium]